MKPACPKCRTIHPSNATRIVGMFSYDYPVFRADYDGAPRRHTRAEAEADYCKRIQEKP
jgi:hypothetical protein